MMLSASAYAKSLAKRERERYEKKLTTPKGIQLPDPYSLKEGWSDTPENWPDVTYGDIYNYLIDMPGLYSKETMKAYKSLEGYQYFEAGHVKTVFQYSIEDEPFSFVKADVVPSQRVNDDSHNPWACLSDDGSIYCAHCTCMAGLGEVCSHVGALLFKIEVGVKLGMNHVSSTSAACKWNSTFREHINPEPITENPSIIKSQRRHDVESIAYSQSSPLPKDEVLLRLKECIPNAAFFTLIPSVGDKTVESDEDQLLDSTSYPPLFTSYFTGKSPAAYLCYKTEITDEMITSLELLTRNQLLSPLWAAHRIGRVTASMVHQVSQLRKSTNPLPTIKTIMGKGRDISHLDAIEWGITYETVARETYTTHMTRHHANFTCRTAGFKVYKDMPFLGASADGIGECSCHGKRVLEIKCPSSAQFLTVGEAVAQGKIKFLDEKLELKESHKYYTQLQAQMFCHGTTHGDFVVWTPTDFLVKEQVPFDESIKQKIDICEQFFKKNILPVLCDVTLSSSDNDSEPEVICSCRKAESGRMVACDSNSCKYQWFHYKCVGVKRKPKGKWYCPECRKN